MKLKDMAINYVAPRTMVISDWDKIPVDLDVEEATATNKDGEEFTYLFAEIEGIKYRVPGVVLGGIKSVLTKFPSCEYVTVDKEGQGLQTKYTVLPVIENGKK
jgi:hypothetical protein